MVGPPVLAVDEGILGRILVPDGSEGVQVNQPIALLLAEGEDASSLDSDAPAAPTEADVKPMIERAIAWFEGDVIERPGQGAERTGA